MQLPPEERTISGKLAIVSIGLLALAASVGAWLYHTRLQKRALEFWEPPTAQLMIGAPRIEAERLDASGRSDAAGARSVATAPGIVHLRPALIHDASFDWSAMPPAAAPEWRWRLRLIDEGQTANVEFSDNGQWVKSPSGRIGRLVDPVAAEIVALLERELGGRSLPASGAAEGPSS